MKSLLNATLVCGLLLGTSISHAATMQWHQTDWSDGVGENTQTAVSALNNVDVSSNGEFKLAIKNDWWDGDWKFRQVVTVNNTDTTQANYPVRLSIPFESSMQSDFADLRFTNSNGDNLDYWVQSVTTSTQAIVWVEIDSLAGSGDTLIYVYYGNNSVASASDGEATFPFFDDFSSATIDTNKWTVGNAGDDFNIIDDELAIGVGGSGWSQAIYANQTFNRSDLSLEFDYEWVSDDPSYDALMMGWKDNTSSNSYNSLVYAYYNQGANSCTTDCLMYTYEDGSARGVGGAGSWSQNTPYSNRIRMRASGGAYYEQSIDGGESYTLSRTSTYSTESDLRPGMTLHSGLHNFDNVRIRPWMATEPTSTFGNSEISYQDSGTLTSNIFNADAIGAVWQDIGYAVNDSNNTEVRVRSAANSDMSDAIDFSSCSPLTSDSELSSNSCISNGDRFVQYQVTLTPNAGDSPSFSDLKINFLPSFIDAKAGADRVVVAGRSIQLDGVQSAGNDLVYNWALLSGEGTLSNETTATPTFTSFTESQTQGVIVYLTVIDSLGQRSTDQVTIRVVGGSTVTKSSQNVVASFQGGSFQEALTETESGEHQLELRFQSTTIQLPEGDNSYVLAVTDKNNLVIGTPDADNGSGQAYFFSKSLDELNGSINLQSPELALNALHSSESQFKVLNPSLDDSSLQGLTAIDGNQDGDRFGQYIASGDLDGDNCEEVLISAPGCQENGCLYIYDCQAEFVGMIRGTADYPIASVQLAKIFGSTTPDIILGPDNLSLNQNIAFDDPEGNTADQLVLLSGNRDWSGVTVLQDATIDVVVSDTSSLVGFTHGDLNQDGNTDLLIANNGGDVVAFWGPLAATTDLNGNDANFVITGGNPNDDFGVALEIIDINQDQKSDLVIGAPSAGAAGAGHVYLVFGDNDWPAQLDLSEASNVLTISGDAGQALGRDFLVTSDEANLQTLYATCATDELCQLAISSLNEEIGDDTTSQGLPVAGAPSASGGCSFLGEAEGGSNRGVGIILVFFTGLLFMSYRPVAKRQKIRANSKR